MKKRRNYRRFYPTASILGLAAACAAGCSSSASFTLADLNPLSKSGDAVAAGQDAAPKTGHLASFQQTVSGQASNLSMAASSAWGKTKQSVGGLFSPGGEEGLSLEEQNDPTRLATATSVSPEVYVAQGALWENTGDQTKAMDSYQRAIQAEPQNAAALAAIARLHQRQQNYPLASEAFTKALAVSPNDAALLNDYGLVLAKLGQTAEADAAFTKALAISPGTSRFANNQANVRFDAGNKAGALETLMQHNKPAVAQFNMAYLHFQAGEYAEAKNNLSEVLKYEPTAGEDSAVAQAVSRSREMLTTIDSSATRIAQAGSGVLSTANQISTALSATNPAAGQNAVVPSSGTAPANSTTPASGTVPAGSQPAASEPAAATANGGGFVLPPGVFDQPIR